MILITSLNGVAQNTNRYMVFFKDKADNNYSMTHPQEFLTSRAILRIGRSISEEDLPVTKDYLDQLSTNNATIIGTTKWLNGALAIINEVDLSEINDLSFVSRIEYVAPGTKPSVGGRVSSDYSEGDIEVYGEVLVQQSMLNTDMMNQDGFDGGSQLVAVLDGGFTNVDEIAYFSHLYESGQIVDVHNFVTTGKDIYDYSDHGTRVFSTIAASGSDYVGIATGADYLLYVTEASGEYRIEEYNWLMAAERADSIGVDIITTSVGYSYFDDASMDYAHDDLDGKTAIVTIAAEKAFERGIVVVSSAGNSGNRTWQKVTPPADGENILAIGSVGENQQRDRTSSIGPVVEDWTKPDLMAMGSRALIIGESGIISSGSGTSFAAPQVAGLIAGIHQKYPELSNIELIDIIRASADRASSPDNQYGNGIPSYLGFVNYYEQQKNILSLSSMQITTNPITDDVLRIKANPDLIDKIGVIVFTMDGKKVLTCTKELTWADNPVEIPVGSLSKGIYIMKIFSDEEIITSRVVKQ
jgi:subtilisin family serine protease